MLPNPDSVRSFGCWGWKTPWRRWRLQCRWNTLFFCRMLEPDKPDGIFYPSVGFISHVHEPIKMPFKKLVKWLDEKFCLIQSRPDFLWTCFALLFVAPSCFCHSLTPPISPASFYSTVPDWSGHTPTSRKDFRSRSVRVQTFIRRIITPHFWNIWLLRFTMIVGKQRID